MIFNQERCLKMKEYKKQSLKSMNVNLTADDLIDNTITFNYLNSFSLNY